MFAITSALLLVLYVTTSQANDIRLGYAAAPSSKKIFSEIRQADPALWTRTDDVIINTVGTEVISAVYVTDLRDDKDGVAYIESGGIGMKSVTIGLKSPSILRGYKFEVEVYADDTSGRFAGYNTKGGIYPNSGLSGAYIGASSNYGVKGGASYTPYDDNGQYSRKY